MAHEGEGFSGGEAVAFEAAEGSAEEAFGIDLVEAAHRKLAINARKYPVELAPADTTRALGQPDEDQFGSREANIGLRVPIAISLINQVLQQVRGRRSTTPPIPPTT